MLITHSQSDSVLSLFSGAGGFSYGFASAGLPPICGAEIDKDACATYEENVGSTCHNVDISAVEPNFFRDVLGAKEPSQLLEAHLAKASARLERVTHKIRATG
jgi:DNA (cytosine-5)-methyltransferase 1